jgi:preprotein translocase subunit SecG
VGFIISLLTGVYFLTCVILIVVVLMQEPKGGGLSSAFGGAGLDTAFGASIGRKMSSFTVYLAVFFLILTIGLAILTKGGTGTLSGSYMEGVEKTQAPAGPGEPEKRETTPKQPQEGTAPNQQESGQSGKSAPSSP